MFLKAAGPGFVPATGTQELAQVEAKPGLSKKMRTASNTLRLSDFLTGVKPKVVQLVQGWRPDDEQNDGCGVLMRYELSDVEDFMPPSLYDPI